MANASPLSTARSSRIPQPRPSGEGRAKYSWPPAGNGAPVLRLELTRPHPHTVLLALHGELDQSQTARLTELLGDRMRSLIHTLVLDCTHVSFLCVDILELLNTSGLRARQAGITLAVVTGRNPAVRRALHAGELDGLLTLGETVEDLQLLPTAVAPSREDSTMPAISQRKPMFDHA